MRDTHVTPRCLQSERLRAFSYFHTSDTIPKSGGAWEQLTFFADAAVYPSLSPDGRLLTFIHGDNTFFGPGQIFVKLLPSGEPTQLTHDKTQKMSPAFSPDGTRIAYSVVDPGTSGPFPFSVVNPSLCCATLLRSLGSTAASASFSPKLRTASFLASPQHVAPCLVHRWSLAA